MMITQRSDDGSHLFLVRVWVEAGTPESSTSRPDEDSSPPFEGDGCHGRVQHVISGEAASFVDWTTLTGAIRNIAAGSETSPREHP